MIAIIPAEFRILSHRFSHGWLCSGGARGCIEENEPHSDAEFGGEGVERFLCQQAKLSGLSSWSVVFQSKIATINAQL